MMSHLKIQNFLSLRDVDIEIKPLTVLVGPQATGKSLIAKLVYLFNHIPVIVQKVFLGAMQRKENANINAALEDVEKLFINIFPAYSWKSQSFHIFFEDKDMQISIKNNGEKLEVVWAGEYIQLIKSFHPVFEENYKEIDLLKNKFFNTIKKLEKEEFFRLSKFIYLQMKVSKFQNKDMIFVPAERSFFAMIQKNPFFFWREEDSVPVDYFIKEFGSFYSQLESAISSEDKNTQSSFSLRIPAGIVDGSYEYDSKEMKGYIRHDNDVRTEMKDASSGEQEFIPIFLVLNRKHFFGKGCIIEEPEAHLFPGAQKEMTKLLAENFNQSKSLFITTHSPYLLTVFNNLVHAGLLERKFGKDQDKIKKLNRVVAKKYRINPSEFAAYLVDRGVVKDIVNSKSKLINASTIDAVSDKIFSEFDQLLELES